MTGGVTQYKILHILYTSVQIHTHNFVFVNFQDFMGSKKVVPFKVLFSLMLNLNLNPLL